MDRSSHQRQRRASPTQLGLAFEERAAICEHVGRLSPAAAELIARREAGLEPPAGVSDVTGGPLNAIEALRANCGESLRCVGLQTEDGARCCRACLDVATAAGRAMPRQLEGRGFGMFVWHARSGRGDARPCVICGHGVTGEIGR